MRRVVVASMVGLLLTGAGVVVIPGAGSAEGLREFYSGQVIAAPSTIPGGGIFVTGELDRSRGAPGAPSSGYFTIQVNLTTSDCKGRDVPGLLTIAWNDSTTSQGSVTANVKAGKAEFNGDITAGAFVNFTIHAVEVAGTTGTACESSSLSQNVLDSALTPQDRRSD